MYAHCFRSVQTWGSFKSHPKPAAFVNDNYDSANCVCAACVGDAFLRAHIEGQQVAPCHYCANPSECITLRDLADLVHEVYRYHFKLGHEEPVFYEDSDRTWYEKQGGYPAEIVAEIVQCDEQLACDIVSLLSDKEAYDVAHDGLEPLYYDAFRYTAVDLHSMEEEQSWKNLTHRIKHDTRFFSESVLSPLNNLLGNLSELQLHNHAQLLPTISPRTGESTFFRARRAKDQVSLDKIRSDPARHLGTPPPGFASAGRMNAAGIPVFYGADSAETCIAELRPPVGSYVATGRFEITRPIKVLDLTKLDRAYANYSRFDPAYESKTTRLQFLQRFEDKIARPIMPDDEALEYLPTQALAEFFRDHYSPNIDAIFYRSVQRGPDCRNIAILGDAANVEFPEPPPHVDDAHGEIDEPPPSGNIAAILLHSHRRRNEPDDDFVQRRKFGLQYVEGSFRLHEVKSVNYSTGSASRR